MNGALGALICGALGVLLYSVYSSKMNTVVPVIPYSLPKGVSDTEACTVQTKSEIGESAKREKAL